MSAGDSETLLRVLKGLLRPLVRILITRGVTAPAFYRLLKSTYVEVAYDDFRIDDTPPTDSRVSLLTGVHRRDVRSILSSSEEPWETSRAKVAIFATVIGQWMSRPEFQASDGSPLPLPRKDADGIDFEGLVQSVSRDIRPRTILDEVMRQGLVKENADGLLMLEDGAVLGPSSDEHKVIFFAANVGDHLAAAAENLTADTPPYLERAVFYNRLTAASVDKIEDHARAVSQAALEALNADGSAYQNADKDKPDNHERFRFGVYFYREPALPGDQINLKDDTSAPD